MTSRRAFLRGAGATLALPYLNWSSRADAAPVEVPKRFIVFINGEGNLNHDLCDNWTPPKLADGSLKLATRPSLAMLEPYQDRMVVIRGVDNVLHDFYKSANGHLGSGHTFLSASLPRNAIDDSGQYIPFDNQAQISLDTCCVGPSLDHYLASKLGAKEPIHLGVNEPFGGEYHPFYKVTKEPDGLSNTQVNLTVDPTVVFNSYIATLPKNQQSRLDRYAARRTNVLDAVRDSFNDLYSKVGRDDRQRLQQHAQRISELQASLAPNTNTCGDLTMALPEGYPGVGQSRWGSESPPFEKALSTAQINNLVQMITCGSRNVMSLTFDSYGTPVMPWLANDTSLSDADRAWFPISKDFAWHGRVHRDQGSAANHPVLVNGFQFYGNQFKYMLDQMDAVIEPNGKSLLDNSLILWLSEFGDGGSHSTDNLPVVLAGGLQGALKTGRFIDVSRTATQKTRYSVGDLLTSILHLYGINETFGYTGQAGLNNGGIPGLVG